MFTASYISCPLSPATAYTNRHMSIHHHRGVAGSSAAPDLNNDTIPYYFDSDMSKSTNTVVYFDWKTVIYIYGIFKLFLLRKVKRDRLYK